MKKLLFQYKDENYSLRTQLYENNRCEAGLNPPLQPHQHPWLTKARKNIKHDHVNNIPVNKMPVKNVPVKPVKQVTVKPKNHNLQQNKPAQPAMAKQRDSTMRYTMHAKRLSHYQLMMREIAQDKNVDWKKEMEERKVKKLNTVILNLHDPKPTTVLTEEQRTNPDVNIDLHMLRELATAEGKNADEITQVFRMGRELENRTVPRPIKVMCSTPEMKEFLMNAIEKIKQHYKCNDGRIRHDRTVLQRMTSREMYLTYHKYYKKSFREEGNKSASPAVTTQN